MSITAQLSDRYVLSEALGSGGMSEVYHGRDVELNRDVAVKVLRADLASDRTFHEGFRREARHAAALNHPAIVAVYDIGETDPDARPYIVMEYVEGRTLRDIVKTDGPMPPRRAMEVMADVCAALDFSHRHGIIHCDVKPGNVMLTDRGAVKVMDFGIARAVQDEQAAATQTAAVLGTARYLSPEQARGEQLDARSDVYAAGCVLYELITGQAPFAGDSVLAVVHQHVNQEPSAPSTLTSTIPSELDAVVLKSLAKGPVNRYQSAAEMRTDLVRVLSHQRPRAPKVITEDERTAPGASRGNASVGDHRDQHEGQRRRRLALPIALAALVGLIVSALWLTGAFDRGQPVVAVPSIVGQQYLEAERMLREAGFADIKREPVPCWAPAHGEKPACGSDDFGRVLDVHPSEGSRVAASTRIVMHIGQAPETLPMPDLMSKTLPEAERILSDHHLLLNPTIGHVDNDDPAKAGTVAEQVPRRGVTVAVGDEVQLAVYRQPETAQPEMVPVVDYNGQQYDVANAGLTAAGFTVVRIDIDSDRPAGEVVHQRPDRGEAIRGSDVVLKVSTGSDEPITMPQLVGTTEDEAREALTSAGHTGDIRITRTEVTHRDQDGIVTATTPTGGDTVPKSGAVTLRVGEYTQPEDATPPPTTEPTRPPPTSPTTPPPDPEQPEPHEPEPDQPDEPNTHGTRAGQTWMKAAT